MEIQEIKAEISKIRAEIAKELVFQPAYTDKYILYAQNRKTRLIELEEMLEEAELEESGKNTEKY